MPEYVYALHDFTPENPDEVAFKVGDRIEVIEKDDLYGDGWWQVSLIDLSLDFTFYRVFVLSYHGRLSGRPISRLVYGELGHLTMPAMRTSREE